MKDPIDLKTKIYNTPFQNAQKLKSFVTNAKSKGMRVEMIDGRPSMTSTRKRYGHYSNIQ